MTKTDVIRWIGTTKIVPVIRASAPDIALKVAGALIKGGVDVLEVTMTVPGATDVIREVTTRYPNALVGAGTVYDPTTAKKCVEAGAKFIVGPCFDEATVKACNEMDVMVAPGAFTPSEVVQAWKAGADIVKIFPCDAGGGPSYIKSLKAPFPNIAMMPTGGVSLANVQAFLAAGAVAVGVGNSLVDPKIIAGEDWNALAGLAAQFRAETG